MEHIVREWDYWAYLFRVVHRQTIPGIQAYDDQLIAFIMAALAPRRGQYFLDLACGSGVHAVQLGQQGLKGVGVDISPSLVAYANELSREQGIVDSASSPQEDVRFVVGDMREALCSASGFGKLTTGCDFVTILSHSFGFFGPEGDRAVLDVIRTTLYPGGRFLLDLSELARLKRPQQSWQALDGGFLLSEAHYDPVTCVRTSNFRYIDRQGRVNVAAEPERIRLYTLPELTGMIEAAGLQVEAVYGRMALPLTPYSATCCERRLLVGRKP